MSRTARLWKGVGPLTLGGILLSCGIAALADESPSLSQQLTSLGRQAAANGKADDARTFYRNALKLDPTNAEAKAGLSRVSSVRLVSFQDPVVTPPAAASTRHPGGRERRPRLRPSPLERQSQPQ